MRTELKRPQIIGKTTVDVTCDMCDEGVEVHMNPNDCLPKILSDQGWYERSMTPEWTVDLCGKHLDIKDTVTRLPKSMRRLPQKPWKMPTTDVMYSLDKELKLP